MNAARKVDSDADLERRIEQARLRYLGCRTPAQRRKVWDELTRLIAQRSPEQIERMERDRGLRA